MNPDRLPVIVGVGELADRPASLGAALSPLELMQAALRRAEEDTGARLLPALDSLTVVRAASWPVAQPAARLAAALGCRPARLIDTAIGGHQPLEALQQAASAIAEGRSEVAAVLGGEAESTVRQAARETVTLDWAKPETVPPTRAGDAQQTIARQLEADRPAQVYPLYENALPSLWGTTPVAEQAESAALWSSFSQAAATRPAAWLGRPHSAAEIASPGPDNRLVAWPYTKLMTANPAVNQGAAVLVTSLARARALGLDESRLVHLHGGAAAREPDDILARDGYGRSLALECALQATRGMIGDRALAAAELYSCFPCVPKLALRVLELPEGVAPTVTGGLTFFGAPLNNLMTHAAVAMVQRLRESGGLGLLYGQGGYLTAHRALLLGRAPPVVPAADLDLHAAVFARYGAVPAPDQEHRGAASLETFTLLYDRAGAVRHGIAICLTPTGGRLMARVPASDRDSVAALAQLARSPIGDPGHIGGGADGLPEWHHG